MKKDSYSSIDQVPVLIDGAGIRPDACSRSAANLPVVARDIRSVDVLTRARAVLGNAEDEHVIIGVCNVRDCCARQFLWKESHS